MIVEGPLHQGAPPGHHLISGDRGVDQRARNRYVFQRVLARLSRDARWVLKGGFSLELRLGLAARTTKDLDLLLTDVGVAECVRSFAQEALARSVVAGNTFMGGVGIMQPSLVRPAPVHEPP